jgi:hypothetical protein
MGIVLSGLGAAAAVAASLWNVHSGTPKVFPWVCFSADTLFLVWWIVFIRANRVKVPSFAYAERLLECTENLSPSRKAPVASGAP